MRRRHAGVVIFIALLGGASLATADEPGASRPPERGDPGPMDPGAVKVSIEAEHEPLLAVLKKLCAAHALNYVASETALEKAGKVSLRLTDVPLDEALDSICEVYGLEARLRGRILVVRAREGGPAPVRPLATERRSPEPRPGNRFLPEDPAPKPPPPAPAAPGPATAAPAPPPTSPPIVPVPGPDADLSRVHVPVAGGGAIVVGTVVEITSDCVTVKPATGDPRPFHVPGAHEGDSSRSSRLVLALGRIKRGDRIALEYRIEDGRAVVTNLVAGGKPQQ